MSARSMILGALMESPAHGYELKTRYMKKVFADFGINDGQLYPLLRKLEQQGMIKKTVVPREGAPSRHKYSLTPEGRDGFLEWLADDQGEDQSIRYDFMRRDEFFVRCNFIRHLDRDTALEKLSRQIQLTEKTLADFHGARDRMIEKKVDPYRIKILEYGIRNQEARLDWLRDFHTTIKKDRKFNKNMCRKKK